MSVRTNVVKFTLAVELANDCIKIAQLADKRGGALKKVVIRKLSDAQSAQTIAKAIESAGFKKGPVLAFIPRPLVTVRMLEFPSVDPAEIADMVDLQVTRQTPYSRDEIIFDFKNLGSERDGYSRIMLVIVQSAVIRHRFGILEEAGLKVTQISIGTEGIVNWAAERVVQSGQGDDLAILDLDASHADLCIVRNGRLAFNRAIAVGADSFASEGETAQQRLFQELARAIETFRNEMPGAKVERMILSGGMADAAWVIRQLQKEFGVTVEERPAWQDPAAAGLIQSNADMQGFSITALLGASLSSRPFDIDLTPEAVLMRRELAVQARSLTTMGILVMAMLGLAALFVEGRLLRSIEEVRRLRARADIVIREADAVRDMKERVDLVKTRLDMRLCSLNLLYEVARLAPETIAFTAVQIEEGRQVVLRGTAAAESEVNKFVSTLDSSPLLAGVKSTRVGGREKKEFEIVCLPEK